ncbi:MAG: hypothetical protein V7691_00850 [Galbibacter orientalis]|uniref:hypothetical protein n=1 Tax=Galbibacter orientalis TaxID=453852 RepID=UPI00300377FD
MYYNNIKLVTSISTITTNYVTPLSTDILTTENPFTARVLRVFYGKFLSLFNDTFPTPLCRAKTISIPRGVKRAIERLPKNILNRIDKNKDIAVEKCLIMVSNLTSTIFKENDEGYKCLSSKILHKQLKKGNKNTYNYTHVLNALMYGAYPIIECKRNKKNRETYQSGVASKQYKLTDKFHEKDLTTYKLKNPDSISKRKQLILEKQKEAKKNPIGKNLLSVYGRITIPSNEEIIKHGKELIKQGYKTKKGKQLSSLNKKPKKHYKDRENRSFIEDSIKKFKHLTSHGYMTPIIGDSKSGGRVFDSFNLMPSWIRELCLIDGEKIVELDFTALHPNIAISIYGGKIKYLTHQDVAKSLGKEIKEVKREHLAFFNKNPKHMKKSILFNYYKKNEPKMLNKILQDKTRNGYKSTSRLLFKKEVDIMSEVIEKLNREDIYVLYVYDALYCKESDSDRVKEVMDKTRKDHGVFTCVK